MSQGKHIGKIAISQLAQVRRTDQPLFEKQAAYLVTGGLGAIGRQLVPWMIRHGAGNIALVMHRELRGVESPVVTSWRDLGATVTFHRLDGSDTSAVDALVKQFDESGVAIRGVFHLAGVLHDGLAAESKWEDFEEVLEAKSLLAWNLHQSLRSYDLQCFVLFSSIASLFGSPGQANYAAANAFLDGLAGLRRDEGMPGLSIQWGPWSGRGMAEKFHDRGKQWGIDGLDVESALGELERLLRSDLSQASIVELEVVRFSQTIGTKLSASLVRSLQSQKGTAAKGSEISKLQVWKDRLRDANASSRVQVISEFLENTTLDVLGLPSWTSLDPRQPLRELGLDSLMAVEMKNILADVTQLSLDATILFDHPTMEALSRFLASRLEGVNDVGLPSEEPATAFEHLSTDDIAAELAEELALLRLEDSGLR